jgi:hypothetical protein
MVASSSSLDRFVQGVADGVAGSTGVVNRPGKCLARSSHPLPLAALTMGGPAEQFL